MSSIADRIRTLISRGNARMSTSYPDLTSVVNNLVGGYNEASWIDLGSGQSFDVKKVCLEYGIDYTTLTNENFLIASASSFGVTLAKYISDNYAPNGSTSMTKSYNASTGVLTAYVNTYISWVHMDGSSKSVSPRGNVHAIMLLAKKANNAGSYADLGTGSSFDVKPVCEAMGIDYKGLTVENFMCSNVSGTASGGNYTSFSNWSNTVSTIKNYNNSTGILSFYVKADTYLRQEGSSGHYICDANVHAYLILAKKVGTDIDNVSIAGNVTRTGSGSASVTVNVGSKVLAIYANGGENGGRPSITVRFTDGTSIAASSTNGAYGATDGYYDKGVMWVNNGTYKDKTVSSVTASIGASYSRIICQVALYE